MKGGAKYHFARWLLRANQVFFRGFASGEVSIYGVIGAGRAAAVAGVALGFESDESAVSDQMVKGFSPGIWRCRVCGGADYENRCCWIYLCSVCIG